MLLPPLIKRDFPERTGLMMGVYTMGVSGAAAVAAGVAVPLAGAGLGWRVRSARGRCRPSLQHWSGRRGCVPAERPTRPSAVPPTSGSLLRDPLAWQLTVFFGLQALSFYAVLAWLPSMYRDFGASPASAGFLLSLSGLVQIPVSLVVPGLAGRARHQVWFATGATALIGVGLLGVLLAPMAAPAVWVVLVGAGQGACFALGLNLFVLRTRAVSDTARVSGDGAEHRLHHLRTGPAARRRAARRRRGHGRRLCWSSWRCWCLSWFAERAGAAGRG